MRIALPFMVPGSESEERPARPAGLRTTTITPNAGTPAHPAPPSWGIRQRGCTKLQKKTVAGRDNRLPARAPGAAMPPARAPAHCVPRQPPSETPVSSPCLVPALRASALFSAFLFVTGACTRDAHAQGVPPGTAADCPLVTGAPGVIAVRDPRPHTATDIQFLDPRTGVLQRAPWNPAWAAPRFVPSVACLNGNPVHLTQMPPNVACDMTVNRPTASGQPGVGVVACRAQR